MLINVARDASSVDASSDDDLLQDEHHRESFQRIEPQLNGVVGEDGNGSKSSARPSADSLIRNAGMRAKASSVTNTAKSKASTLASSRFFMSPWRQTVIDTVRHLIALQQPVIWVTGIEGVGKSTILQHFVTFLSAQSGQVFLLAAQDIADTTSVYAWLWEKIQGTRANNITLEVLLVALSEFSQLRGTLRLLMDDVDQLTDAQIVELLRLQAALPVDQVQSILFAHPSVMDVCQAPACQMIDQSMAEWVDVPPFNLKETHQFIEFYCLQHQMPSPGWRVEKIKRLHAKTEGLPGKLVPILQSQGQAISVFSQWGARFGVLPWIALIVVGCGLLLWVVFAKQVMDDAPAGLVLTPSANEPINLAAVANLEAPVAVQHPSSTAVNITVPAVAQFPTEASAAIPAAVEEDFDPLLEEPIAVTSSEKNGSVTSGVANGQLTKTPEVTPDSAAFAQVEQRSLANVSAANTPSSQNVINSANSRAANIADTSHAKTFAQNKIEKTRAEKIVSVKVAGDQVLIDKISPEKPIPAIVASQWESAQSASNLSIKADALKVDQVKNDQVKIETIKTASEKKSTPADQPLKSSVVKSPILKSDVGKLVADLKVAGESKGIEFKKAIPVVPVDPKYTLAKVEAVKAEPKKLDAVPAKVTAVQPEASTFTKVNVAEQWEYRTWLMQREPSHYTLQLLGSANKQRVLDFIQQFGPNSNGKLAYFPTLHEGQPWFVVIYGDFASAELAQAASPDVQPTMVMTDPWARSFASIQSGLK